MFLLILSECCRQCGITLFTFHDVSINTTTRFYCLKLKFSLHSTMFLLIRWLNGTYNNTKKALHSTMFLLIQKQTQTDLWVFQTLHSTMFLLIHVSHAEHCKFPGITLHSTMFLLILKLVANKPCNLNFTFHDVSINTQKADWLSASLVLYIPRCFY